MTYVIQLICLADGRPTEFASQWLKSFDAEASATSPPTFPTGDAVWTKNIDEAMTFVDHGSAFACWRQRSVTVPKRPDGKPNRPLTAFSCSIVPKATIQRGDPTAMTI